LEIIKIAGFDNPLEDWQVEMANIAMLPKALRPSPPITMGKLGITKMQYYYWLRHPMILKAKRLLTKRYFQDDIPDILQAMRDEALSGNPRAAEIFLEYVDEWKQDEEDSRAIKREVFSKVAVQEMLDEFRNKKL